MSSAAVPAPSPFVIAQFPLIAAVPAGARILDLACGAGRHARACLERGWPVLAVDRDVSGLADLAEREGLQILQWDLEDGRPWPFAQERFRAVIVVNYLFRPTLADTVALVAPGGLLVYETFGVGNERFGRPSNPDFLARPGELAATARAGGFEIVEEAFGEETAPRPAVKARLVARRPLKSD